MKKILFIASAILILLSGCENFLDSELLTEYTIPPTFAWNQ